VGGEVRALRRRRAALRRAQGEWCGKIPSGLSLSKSGALGNALRRAQGEGCGKIPFGLSLSKSGALGNALRQAQGERQGGLGVKGGMVSGRMGGISVGAVSDRDGGAGGMC